MKVLGRCRVDFSFFIRDRRSFRGHLSLTLPPGARAWEFELLVTLKKSISPRSVLSSLLATEGFLIGVSFLVEMRSLGTLMQLAFYLSQV